MPGPALHPVASGGAPRFPAGHRLPHKHPWRLREKSWGVGKDSTCLWLPGLLNRCASLLPGFKNVVLNVEDVI